MKANLNETMTTPLTSLHRKSTAAIHRGASSRQQGASGGGVGRSRLSELAAAVASPNASEEMQLYFSKLKELVPFMPRNRKLSKLEIIQYVIDYICDLQLALETQPKSNAVAVAASLAAASAASSAAAASPPQQLRQPLGVIASNNTSNGTCAVQEASFSHSLPLHGHSLPLHDKSPLCGVDSTVSC